MNDSFLKAKWRMVFLTSSRDADDEKVTAYIQGNNKTV